MTVSYTLVGADLQMTDEELERAIASQWRRFEKESWWPWYEKFGAEFFGPAGSPTLEVSTPEGGRGNRTSPTLS